MPTKRKNPADLTTRNLHAALKKNFKQDLHAAETTLAVKRIKTRLQKLEAWAKKNGAAL
jgi:hypothetical protein